MAECVVVGPGGVGGYLAAVLAGGGVDVAVVARGEHADAIRRDGLRLDDPQRPEQPPARVHVAGTLDDAPASTVLVLATKHTALPAIEAVLPAYLARCPADAVVVTLQNGVCHLDSPLVAAAAGRVVAGSVYIFSALGEPGLVRVIGGPRHYRLGPLDASDTSLAAAAASVAARWSEAGLLASAEPDGRRVCWEKLCVLAPLSGLTALTGRTVGELREDEDAMRTVRTVAAEIAAIAAAEGVPLDDDIPERCEAGLRMTDAAGRSSLHLDLSLGRPSEVDVLLGDPVRRADRHSVPVPALRAVLAATRVRHGVAAPS